MPDTVAELKVLAASFVCTQKRLQSFAEDMVMAKDIGLEPWEVARVVQTATGNDLYLLGPKNHMARWAG